MGLRGRTYAHKLDRKDHLEELISRAYARKGGRKGLYSEIVTEMS